MPTVIASAAAWLGSTVFAGTTFGAALMMGQWATVIGTVATAAAGLGFSAYQRRRAKQKARDAYNSSLQDRLVMTSTTDGPRSRVYGTVRNVDGIVYKATSGEKSEFYTFVVALAGHEVEEVQTVYFDDMPVTLDGEGYVTTEPYSVGKKKSKTESKSGVVFAGGQATVTIEKTPIGGSVAASSGGSTDSGSTMFEIVGVAGTSVTISYPGIPDGTYDSPIVVNYQYTDQKSKARVWKYTGAAGQNIGDLLISLGVSQEGDNKITTNHKFSGMAALVVQLEYDQEAFPTGVPSFSAIIKGAKIYDPRTDTVAWEHNPALIARDWATYRFGCAIPEDQIDDSIIIASANACDVLHTFETPTSSTVRRMYSCGIVLKSDGNPMEGLNSIVESMAGKWAFSGGVLRVKAGMYTAPVADIDEGWLSGAGSIEVVPGISQQDVVNIYIPSIADETNDYVVSPSPEIRADPYIEDDGRELPLQIDLEGVTDTDHAQHVCSVMLRDQRQSLTVRLPCNLKAYVLEVFDTVTLTLERYGFEEKEFEILSKGFSPEGGVVLLMKETTPIIFDPDAGFSDVDIAPNTNLPLPWVVPPITGFGVSSGGALLDDGSLVTRTVAFWDQVTDMAVLQSGKIEVQYKLADMEMPEEGWNSWVEEGSAVQAVFIGLEINKVYNFRARAINSLGIRGDWTIQVSILIPPPALPGNMGMDLLTSTNVFVVDAGAVISPEKATLRLVRGEGLVEPAVWTVVDGTAVIEDTLDPDIKEIPGLELTTPSATIRATVTQGGDTQFREVTIVRITDGSSAKSLIIGATAFGFVFDNGVNEGPPITFTSYEQNLEGTVTWSAQAYDAEGTALGAVTLTGGPGITRQLTPANFLTHTGTSYVRVTIESTVDGLSDVVSVYRVDSGSSTVTMFLTNEAHVVPSDSAGNVTSYAGASTEVLIWRGADDETSTWTITRSASAGLTTTQSGTSIVTIAVTNMTTGVNSGYVDITGTKGDETITKRFSVSKSKQGEEGAPGENAVGIYLSASSQVFQVSKAGTPNPSSITLTAVRQNSAASISWAVIAGTATLDDPTAISRRLTFANMGSDAVTVQATITEGAATYNDRITIVKVREGDDGYTVFLTNEAHNLSATSAGVVSDYSACGGTMKVYKGAVDVTTSCAFSVQSNTFGLTTSIGAASGIYQVTGGMNSISVATVEYQAVHAGNTFTKRFTVSKANAGAQGSAGPSGPRGTVNVSAFYSGLTKNTGRANGYAWWSSSNSQPTQGDVGANSAITSATGSSAKIIGDMVTLYNNSNPANATVVVSGVWDGANWLNPGTIIDGNLLVKGTVIADRLAAGQATLGGSAWEIGMSSTNTGAWGSSIQDGLYVIRKSSPQSLSAALRVVDTTTNLNANAYISGYAMCLQCVPQSGSSSMPTVSVSSGANGKGLEVYAALIKASGQPLVDFIGNTGSDRTLRVSGRQAAIFSASSGTSGMFTVYIDGANDFGISAQASYTTAAAFFLNNNASAGGTGAIVRRTRGGTTRNINLATETYSAWSNTGEGKIYIQDGNGPFTGFHEGVIDDDDAVDVEPGDILLDAELVERTSVNDTMFRHVLSSAPNQKGVIGVCTQIYDEIPEGFEFGDMTGRKVIHMNALGEGQINVCGENGNLEKGDLIVTSSTPGKGMVQSDDIVRSYTVARARESVTFNTPEEVRMVACVYLCG